LVQAGVPLYEVQAILGHSTPTMTMRYAHLAPDHLSRATAALENAVSGNGRAYQAATQAAATALVPGAASVN
jgi:hypothetical protein